MHSPLASVVRALPTLLASWLIGVGLSGTATAAPTAQLRIERGPYYVGDPIELHVQVTGLERSPEPTCQAEAPDGTTLTLASVVPTVTSSVQVLNGQVTRTETVLFTCQFVLVAPEAGTYRLEPIRVEQDGQVTRSSPYAVTVEEIPLDPRLRIRVTPESNAVYVGQQIPIRIEWWLDESLDNAIRNYAIRSGLFEDPDTFRFLDDAVATRGSQSLEIHTAAGEIALPADVEHRTENGRRYLVISAVRRMVPLRAGRYALAPATVNVDEVTRWQRDLFGSRRPADARRLFGRDAPLTLDVQPTPEAGRPPSFGGAIGRGFSLEVSADRSVVQVGDPIELTLTVRGDGHLTTVGLPPLDQDDALSPDRFRLSTDPLSGEVADGAKQFQTSVRVIDESVREIPALEYAWFDPELGSYQTTRSRPIALSVRPAEVVSAADVIASPREPRDEASSQARADGGAPGRGADDARGSRSLIGADLSIERRTARLAARPDSALPARVALYGAGVALLFGAGVWRRRAETSPRVLRLLALHRAVLARIDAAGGRPPAEAIAEIASALRELSAADLALRHDAVDSFVRECDEVLYAPSPGNEADVAPRIARARTLAEAMRGAIR